MSTASNSEAITDDPDWTEGDFTLISSDNVRFKVDSSILLLNR